ncbi:hypothetical protein CR513_37251, partial [Mucuna pruriens]
MLQDKKSILTNNNAKSFLTSVGEKFTTFEKLVYHYNKSRSLKVELGEDTLIFHILESLSSPHKGHRKVQSQGNFHYDKKKERKTV